MTTICCESSNVLQKLSIFRSIPMLRKPILFAFAALTLTTLACGIQFSAPITQIKTGPLETETIQVAYSTTPSNSSEISLIFGAGELKIAPGAGEGLLEGSVSYNVSDFKPRIENNGSRIRIEQGSLNIQGIPNFNSQIKNKWDFQLGNSPIRLRLEAGAYKGDIELGGLAIEEIDISDGASEVHLSFSQPNLVEMEGLSYTTGASNVTLRGLGNANLANLHFRSGAGNYLLDFTGELQRDADVLIESGISNIEISVPANTRAQLTFESGLSNIDADGKWSKDGNTYIHPGSGPTLTIRVKMGAGNIELSTDY
jgi:hypothetical protein